MSKRLTLPVAFALGLLYGRGSGARYVEVPPRIVYVPPSGTVAPGAPSADLKEVLEELAELSRGTGIQAEELSSLAEAVRQILGIIQRRDLCLKRIEEASRAFMENKISRSTYVFLVRFYKQGLIETEMEIARLKRAVTHGSG